MAPAQSHGRQVLQEPRQRPQGLVQRAGSRLPLKPANSQLLRLGRRCIHFKAAENIFREAVLIWGPRRPLLANSGAWSQGSSRAAVFRLPARPGLNAGLRRICEGSAPAPGPEGRRGLLGRGREADAGAAHRSRAGGIQGANMCGRKGGLDGASPGGADRPESLLRRGQERWAFSAFQAPSACGRVGSRRRRPADALEGVISAR